MKTFLFVLWSVFSIPAYAFQVTSSSPTLAESYVSHELQIKGTDLASTSTVTVGTTNCTIFGRIATLVRCRITGLSPGTYSIRVRTSSGQTMLSPNQISYSMRTPTLSGIVPNIGSYYGGQVVTLTGNFLDKTTSVKLGAVNCAITSKTLTQVKCTTGASTVVGKVDVTALQPNNIITKLPGGFTYLNESVTSLSPAYGPLGGGTTLTIGGGLLDLAQSVTIGGVNCSINSKTIASLKCTTGARSTAGLVDVVVKFPAKTVTKAQAFRYRTTELTSITPTSGPAAGGTTVTIKGYRLDLATTVRLGGVNCSIGTKSTETLTCATGKFTPPQGSTQTQVDVVTQFTTGATLTLVKAFTYKSESKLNSMTPDYGLSGYPTQLIFSGENLQTVSEVKIGNKFCSITLLSGTQVKCNTPVNFIEGLKDVTVKLADGKVFTLPKAFTYGPSSNPPRVQIQRCTSRSSESYCSSYGTYTGYFPACVPNCGGRYSSGSCYMWNQDYCDNTYGTACAKNCTSRYSSGSCSQYGVDVCGFEMKCAAKCNDRYDSSGECSMWAQDLCGTQMQCAKNCTYYSDSSGSCLSYGQDQCGYMFACVRKCERYNGYYSSSTCTDYATTSFCGPGAMCERMCIQYDNNGNCTRYQESDTCTTVVDPTL